VRGAVRVKSFTREPGDVTAYGALTDEAGARRYALKQVGRARGALLAEVEGVGDRNAAEALSGSRLYAERGRFPELGANEFYHADLIGLRAESAGGEALGRVRALDNYGAGDVIELTLADGGSAVLPFNRRTVTLVDLAGGRIVLDPPAGLLPERGPGQAKARRRT
jgi:16S rRNA processing protein RimM